MSQPGHTVQWLDTPNTSASLQFGTRTGFLVAEAERGPLFPVLCTSLAAVTSKFGNRQTYSYLYDSAEAAFNEGCPAIWVSRAASSTAVTALRLLVDSAPATTLTVKPLGPGAYGNTQYIEVQTHAEDGTIPDDASFRLRYYDGGSTSGYLVETSPIFTLKAEALAWAPSNGKGSSNYMALTDGIGTGNPVALATAALGTGSGGNTAGADNRGGINDAAWQLAIDKFTMDLGPGKVAMPGQTSTARVLMVIAHAHTRNRFALWDFVDDPTVGTLVSAATAANAAPSSGARQSAGYWPWARVPALPGLSGTRTVPMSGAMMGRWASAEQEGGDAGIAAAGEEHGVFRFVSDLSQDVSLLTDANLATLNDAGVNVARKFYGFDHPVMYGNRTPRLRGIDPVWAEASGSVLAMAIAADLDQIMRGYVFARSSAADRAQCQTKLALRLEAYRRKGALYGETPQEAYSVDATSDAINPAADLQSGLFKASVAYRTSPSPETVVLQLARVSITSTLAAA